MGLRERIEREVRETLRRAQASGGGHVNVTTRLNRVVVSNTGGGQAWASAEQTAPIVQEPPSAPDATGRQDPPDKEPGG